MEVEYKLVVISSKERLGLAPSIRAITPATTGQAIDVPDCDTYKESPRLEAEVIIEPGAEISGLISAKLSPPAPGPRLEKAAKPSVLVVAPTPITLAKSPGELAEPQIGPELPWAKTGMIPAALQAVV
eukprot:Lithocolla_globosa_v1_NODE_379_length_4231_cov_15.911398.p4 type:complete len:128 gc:universal NODE_379_length_4231_cov_15.911398:3975-3592(-)